MVLRRGWKETSNFFWNGTRSTITRLFEEFHEASARRQSSIKSFISTTLCPTVHLYWKRLSIYYWNPGKGTSPPSNEILDYVDHEHFTNRCHVTHGGGCAVFQQGHFLHRCQGHIHVASRFLACIPRQGGWGRLRLGFTRRAITCLLSSTTSLRP